MHHICAAERGVMLRTLTEGSSWIVTPTGEPTVNGAAAIAWP